jgi:hypothetical protein
MKKIAAIAGIARDRRDRETLPLITLIALRATDQNRLATDCADERGSVFRSPDRQITRFLYPLLSTPLYPFPLLPTLV